jgi:hypothetical protein
MMPWVSRRDARWVPTKRTIAVQQARLRVLRPDCEPRMNSAFWNPVSWADANVNRARNIASAITAS